MAQSDNPDNKDGKQEDKNPPSLDQMHEATKRDLEDEDKGDDNADADADDDKGDEDKDKQVSDDNKDGSADDKSDDKSGAGDADEASDDDQAADQPAADVDEDITKPGKDKIKVKSFDGKTYYFNNLDEVPDDFEPASYKEWGRAVQDFTDKAANDRQAEIDRAKAEEQKATERRVNDMQKSWDKDIKDLGLTKEKDIDEVYSYMESQLKEGVVIDNFKQAYKAMKWDRTEEERVKQENKMKKLRGGMVQGGGTMPPEGGRKVFEAPPRGVSLDAVHQNVLRNL